MVSRMSKGLCEAMKDSRGAWGWVWHLCPEATGVAGDFCWAGSKRKETCVWLGRFPREKAPKQWILVTRTPVGQQR